MSDGSSEDTMTEKLLDLQYKLIDTKLGNITSSLANLGSDVKKMLDDHELRLREKTKNDAAVAQQLNMFQMEQKEIKNEIQLLRLDVNRKFEELEKVKEEQIKRELSVWQTIGIEALKYAAFGATGGGVAVAIIKLFGITI